MRSIQAKIVAMFFLLILVAMQFIGTYLLRALETYYLRDERGKRTTEAQLLASDVRSLLISSESSGRNEGSELPPGDGDGVEAAQRERIQMLLQEFNQGRYVHMMILDREGVVIAASDPALVGQRALQETTALSVLEESRARTYQREDPDTGTRRLGAAAPIIGPGELSFGIALVEGDLSVVQQTLRAIREVLFTATALVAAVAIALAWITSRTITGPIKAITAGAAQMAAGDFDRRIRVRSRDELGQLAEMFNHLAGRLRDTLDEISTEKRKVEAILVHMTDGVAAFDRSGRLILINPTAQEMLGVAGRPVSELLGRTPSELWPDWQLDKPFAQVLRGTGERAEAAIVVRHNERTLQTYFAAIESTGHPAAAGAVWVLQDVTEFEKLETMRKEFVANVSHELRTPLTAIKSYSETLLAEDSIDPETQRRFFQVIHDETDRMVRLVRDLLDLSQLEFQHTSWDREYCRLSELARQVLAKLQAQIESKDLQTSIAVGDDSAGDMRTAEEPLVYVDPDRMQQVLVNIVSNAIEFTPRGGCITIRIIPQPGEVRVEVRDTGMGIPAQDLPHIFDRFYRVDKARSRKLGGTGLGLSIARQIVEGHNGRIGIDSAIGHGTSVWFTVPYEPLREPPREPVESGR